MRTARTIGIKEDGTEVILHPKSTCITKQLAEWNKIAAAGIPKGYAAVEYQTSDGPVRTLSKATLVSVKEAEARAHDKQKNAEAWHKKQADERAAREKAEAAERQKKIDASNAAKLAARTALLNPTPTITK